MTLRHECLSIASADELHIFVTQMHEAATLDEVREFFESDERLLEALEDFVAEWKAENGPFGVGA